MLVMFFILTGAAPGCGKSKAVVGQGPDKTKVAPPVVVAPTTVTPLVVAEPPTWNGGILGVAGPAHDEVEPDDDRTTAMAMPLGSSINGTLSSAEDVDVYRVHVDGRGVLRVALEAMAKTDSTLEIFDGQGTLLAKSDRGGAGVADGVPNLGVVPGDYFITVRAFAKAKSKHDKKHDDDKPRKKSKASEPVVEAPATYRLGVAWSAAAPAGSETEPDDEVAVANDLTLGDVVSGYLGWKDDVDTWRMSLETIGDGVGLDIDVGAVDGVALTVAMVDANGKSWFERRGAKGAAVVLSSVQVPMDVAGPSLWISIRGDRSNPIAPYLLTVRGRALVPDEEREPNDTESQATAQAATMRREPVLETGKPADAGVTKPPTHVADAAAPTSGADAPMLHVVGAVPPGDVDLFEFIAPTAGIAHVEVVPNTLLDVSLDIVVHPPGTLAADPVSGKKKSHDKSDANLDARDESTVAGGHSESGGAGVAESLDVDIRTAGSVVVVHVIPRAARTDKSKDKKVATHDVDALAAGRAPAPGAAPAVVDELAQWHYELTAVLRPAPTPSANDELPPEEGSDSHGEH